MATMTTVGYGDVSPTNTAEVVYTQVLLWVSLVVFSGCLGILMNLISSQRSIIGWWWWWGRVGWWGGYNSRK